MRTVLGKKNDNELQFIQKVLINQMERLDDEKTMKENSKKEVMRSGALSQSASAYIKSVATQLKVLEMSGKYNVEVEDMNKFLGINEKKNK